ncbi:hypothetical protein BS78_09G000100 [Paspalum vaginatum]|nr:hypothetical protein BS78_09G000100 [Paspalum vaginatum]
MKVIFLCCCWCCLPPVGRARASSSSMPFPAVCAAGSSRSSPGPVVVAETLAFCGYSGISCCDAADDAMLRDEFERFNVPHDDPDCTNIVKNIICERCIPSPSRSVQDQDPRFVNAAASSTTTPNSRIPRRCILSTSGGGSPAVPQRGGAGTTSMCVVKIGVGSYLNMAAHPDGSATAFFSTQDGKLWLASVPAHGSGGILRFHDGARPFLDLTGRVLVLTGVAFHPAFSANGRFFVSYTRDVTTSCLVSSSANASSSSRPCRYQLVVAEFSAKYKPHASSSYYSNDQQQQQQRGGQILFRRGDGLLYLITGNDGQRSARRGQQQPDSSSSNNKQKQRPSPSSFLGTIICFDVDRALPPGQRGGSSTPPAMVIKPEIFAIGLSNPRDAASTPKTLPTSTARTSTRGGNYSDFSSVVNTALAAASGGVIIRHGRPTAGSRPSIVGGLVYRGSADASLKGRYLYMYGFSAWAAAVEASRSYAAASVRVPAIRCSVSTPVPCRAGAIDGRVLSFGEDSSKDAFILASGGVYRAVRPGLCNTAQQSVGADYTWLLILPFFLFGLYQAVQAYMRMFAAVHE